MWEVIIILVVALIILGPRQLAEAARVLGKLYREIQKLTWEVRDSIDLDSITSPPDNEKMSTREEHEAEEDVDTDHDLVMPAEEKSGPDFYADLLEASDEKDDKEADAPSESPQQEPKGSGKEHEPAEGNRS
jgi:Sec-independent protein translocase protein TatA